MAKKDLRKPAQQQTPRAGERPFWWQGWTRRFEDRRWCIGALLFVIILAAVVRLVDLGADPPLDITWRQDLFTDPPQYTSYARNAIVFGSWNPLNDDRLVFFQKNITGLFSYVLFLITGPGIGPSHLIAVLLNLVGIAFLAWGAGRAFGFLAGWAAAIFLAVNYLFVCYGRLPFLEVASNATLAFAFFALVSSARPAAAGWWAFIGGVVAGAGTFFGKVTALHAAPVFLLSYGLVGWQAHAEPRMRRWVRPLGYAAGMGFVFAVWYVFAYMPASSAVLAYLKEQSIQLYGTPVGLTSVKDFFTQWFSLGINISLLTWASILGAAGLLGMSWMVVRYLRGSSWKSFLSHLPPAVLVLVGWFWSGYAALMPFNYRPVRYQIVLLFPLAGAAGWMLAQLVADRQRARREQVSAASWYAVPVLAVILATGLQHFMMSRWFEQNLPAPMIRGAMIAAMLGTIFSGIWIWVARRRGGLKRSISTRMRGVLELLVALALLGSLVDQGRHFVRWWSNTQHTLVSANRDLEQILGAGAILTGGYGTALTQTGRHGNLPAMLGGPNADSAFFKKFPVTHVAITDVPDEPFFHDYKSIAQVAQRVTTYTLRNLPIAVFRVAELGGNARAGEYQLSPFEQLQLRIRGCPVDSMLVIAPQWISDSVNCFTGWRWLGDLFARYGEPDKALDAYRRAAGFFPDDYLLWARIGDMAWEIYRKGAGSDMRQRAIDAWSRAKRLNPWNPKLAERLAQVRGQ